MKTPFVALANKRKVIGCLILGLQVCLIIH
jgi:hypothetical protein